MALILVVTAVVLLSLITFWIRSRRSRRELEEYTITPEALHSLLEANPDVLIFDVRQPLDLLADSEIIPGARRLDPNDVIANPSLIPQEKDSIVYCTCPSDKTSLSILNRVIAAKFFRVKLLRGGLGAWKSQGYAVEPYTKAFHLDPRP